MLAPGADKLPEMLPTTLPMKFGAVMLPVADIIPGVRMLPPSMLPATLARPAVTKLPPVMLPDTDTVVPV